MIFETDRLVVRQLTEADFQPFHEMQSDGEVMKYTDTQQGLDEAENRRQLQMCLECYAIPENEFWVWATVRKSDHAFLGTVAIVPNQGQPEIGYRFLRKYFGNGYGQEVCDGLIQFAIEKRKYKELVAYVDVRNVASVKILDRSRLAFVEEQKTDDGIIDRFYRWTQT